MKSGVSCNMLQRQELSSLEVAPMLLALRLDFAAQRRCLAEQTCQGPSASKNQVLSFSPSDRMRRCQVRLDLTCSKGRNASWRISRPGMSLTWT
ncbi:unnamed protein product, partial [Symbiodinium sp. KB8]